MAERMKAFGPGSREWSNTSYFRNGAHQGTVVNSIMLGDGTRVEDPRDLLLAVDRSPTANYIESFEVKLKAAQTWSVVDTRSSVPERWPCSFPWLPRDYSSSDSAMSPVITGLLVGGGIEPLG